MHSHKVSKTENFTADADEAGDRIDRVLVRRYPDFSRTYFQSLIEEGAILINHRKPKKREKITSGDTITISFLSLQETDLIPEKMEFDILFEDEHILAINKPAGMVVHPAAGHPNGTFVNGLLYHCQSLEDDGTLRPGIVHRLDKDTSGVLIAAKNRHVQALLTDMFANREVHKEYIAITLGAPRLMHCSEPIGRHAVKRQEMTTTAKGKSADTAFEVETKGEQLCTVRAYPKTGRTHQIRVHLKFLGAPVLGDKIYGSDSASKQHGAERQMLHAARLELTHPITGDPLVLEAPIPSDMEKFL